MTCTKCMTVVDRETSKKPYPERFSGDAAGAVYCRECWNRVLAGEL